MALNLGKRKRVTREELEQPSRSPTPSSEEESSADEDIQERFRRAFEAKFAPLEVETKKRKTEGKGAKLEDGNEESDWSGLSGDDDEAGGNAFDDRDDSSEGEDDEDYEEDEQENAIEVVDYTAPKSMIERLSKAEMRAFMSSKVPSSAATQAPPPPKKAAKDDDPVETSHLRDDLALQKLLRDSQLLHTTINHNASSASHLEANTSTTATGALRHKSADLQLLALGAKKSIHAQKSMPMSHRKGMNEAARKREEKRRQEAKEAGIVLEKEAKKKRFTGERERGIGGPSVGKFKGGMLKLSRKDLKDITGPSEGGRGGRSGRGGKAKRGRR